MADKSKSVELKVGIFVFIGFLVLAWFVLWIGDFNVIKVGYNVKIIFGFANGIKVGAPLRLAGVDQGEVKEITLTHDEATGDAKVIITAWVDSGAKIPKDSRAWVNTLGLLGEKYLEIIPGKDYQNVLAPGDVLRGEDPASIQEVTDLVKDIALESKEAISNLNAVLADMHHGRGTVGRLFTDDKLYTDIEEMFADLKKHPWKLLYRPK